MKNKITKILLILTSIALIACSALVGCKPSNNNPNNGSIPNDGKVEYKIYVTSMGGLGLSDVSVAVTSQGEAFSAGKTDKNGKYDFRAEKGAYSVTVSDLPTGYTLIDANTYELSETKTSLLILASSSVIKESVPSNKIYKQGDVIYDFTITDESVAGNTLTYTLSSVLETKKAVLLNFWNTNCIPCMNEMPELELAYREYKEDAEVLGINVPLLGAQKLKNIRDTRTNKYKDADGETFSLTFPLAIDDNEMPYHFNMKSIPVSVVIDRYGVISLIHSGSMDKAGFMSIFKKYVADDYVQDTLPGEGDENDPSGDGDILVREKPTVSQQDSSVIEEAVNGTGFSGKYRPETETADAEYSWPWLVGETGGVQYIHPANEGVNYSFATIYTDLTITADDIADPNGKVVLVFDLQWSCENLCDYFYLIVNNMLVYEYTGTEQWGEWQPCYALVADEPGEYSICFMYVKDQQLSEGADTVRIKNLRLISTSEISIPSLDMPRNAARGWNDGTSSFSSYISVVKDADGFYHKDTVDGAYVLADLMSTTTFNNRLETSWGVAEFAVNDYFNYNTVDVDDPAYDDSLDDTDGITVWAMAANNSELYGLTLINDELVELLNRFIKSQVKDSYNDNMWLEFCKYFDHYGTDASDKGISTFDRNPIRGLLNITAVPMVKAHEGAFTDLKNIPDEYKNKVVLPRLIVPRGYKYVFEPEVSGVYRFRSQSKELSDTMAWFMDYEAESEDYLVTTDEQLENADEDYNFVLTYYLEAGKKYILAVCFADIGGTGEFTFTTEHLGEKYYAWQFAARNHFTTADDEMTDVINYKNVEPVLHTDGIYYNAKKDASGKYITEDGKYVPNLEDPIYVDFLTGARFFDYGSIELAFARSEKATVIKTLSTMLSALWNKTKPTDGWAADKTLSSIKGSTLTEDDWADIIEKLYTTYDDVYIDDPAAIKEMIFNCRTIGDLAEFLKLNYLNLFDMRNIRFDEKYGIDESRYLDYTELVMSYYEEAKAYKGNPDRNFADRGCVKLTDELRNALDMFCKRVGGFPELDTDWMRLCAHFEYIGPYAG